MICSRKSEVSPLPRLDLTGTQSSASVYDAFGALHGQLSAATGQAMASSDPVGFHGQWGCLTDPETGLVLMTHRYYDAGVGRFLNRDPIRYAGGLNLYGFCGNNPITNADPGGTSGEPSQESFLSRLGWGIVRFFTPGMKMEPGRGLGAAFDTGSEGLGDLRNDETIQQIDRIERQIGPTIHENVGAAVGYAAIEVASQGVGHVVGAAGELGEIVGRARIRKGPAAKSFNWEHIFENHAPWGRVAMQRSRADASIFHGLNEGQIRARVTAAWKQRELVRTAYQSGVKKMVYHGQDPVSRQILEFWFNSGTR